MVKFKGAALVGGVGAVGAGVGAGLAGQAALLSAVPEAQGSLDPGGSAAFSLAKITALWWKQRDAMDTIPPIVNDINREIDSLLPKFESGADIMAMFADESGVLTQELAKVNTELATVAPKFQAISQIVSTMEPPEWDWEAEFGQPVDAVTEHFKDFIGTLESIPRLVKLVEVRDITRDISDVMSELRGAFNLLGLESDSVFGSMLTWASRLWDSFNSLLSLADKLLGAFGKGSSAATSAFSGLFSGGADAATEGAGAATGAGAGGLGKVFSGLGSKMGALFSNPFAIAAVAGLAGFFTLKAIFGKSTFDKVGEEAGSIFADGFSKSLQQNIATLADEVGSVSVAMALSLGDIMAEGLANGFDSAELDTYAEQIGNVFSRFEEGILTSEQATSSINAAIAELTPHLSELGAAGEFQLDRIREAAERLGLTIEGIGALGGPLALSFSGLADELGISKEAAKALADTLGVDVLSETQLLARELGVTPKQLKAIHEAISVDYDIPLQGIQGLLTAMGISIGDLASAFGVKMGGMKSELQQFSADLGNVQAGLGSSGNRGGDHGDNREFAKGGIIDPTPGGELVRVGEGGEREFIVPESKIDRFMGGGGGATVNLNGDINYNIDNAGGDIETLKEALAGNTEDLTGTIIREILIQGGVGA